MQSSQFTQFHLHFSCCFSQARELKAMDVTKHGFFHQKDNPLFGINLQSKSEDLREKYNTWASNFDEDMVVYKYEAPETCVKTLRSVADKYGVTKESKIVDIGAGTGIIGALLKREGYKNIDAVDVSPEMLNKAKSKNCYTKFINSPVGENNLAVPSNEYKVLVCMACLSFGHIKPEGINEMVDIVQSGGLLIFTVRYDADDKFGFKSKVEELETGNKIDIISKDKIDYYAAAGDNDPARFCYLYVCLKK